MFYKTILFIWLIHNNVSIKTRDCCHIGFLRFFFQTYIWNRARFSSFFFIFFCIDLDRSFSKELILIEIQTIRSSKLIVVMKHLFPLTYIFSLCSKPRGASIGLYYSFIFLLFFSSFLQSLGILASIPAAILIISLAGLLLYLLTRCCDRKSRKAQSQACQKFTLISTTLFCCAAVGLGK